ncbi:MAG: hypothetical protein COA78_38270 [Blastopirellula sp.]|nr:MAG: hypothetical protein COA78_38270 [Blastopirellula sp.]
MNCVRFCFAAVAISALMLTGCGGNSTGANSVTGTVKFSDGTPLTAGTVNFNSDSMSTFGDISSDGTCEVGTLDGGVPDGTYTVTVQANSDGSDGKDRGASLIAKNETSITVSGNMTGDEGFEITVEKAK